MSSLSNGFTQQPQLNKQQGNNNGIGTSSNNVSNGHPGKELQTVVIKLLQLFAPPMQSKENTISYRERIRALLYIFVERFPHSSKSPIDDFSLYDQIQKKLINEGRKDKLLKFGELYRDMLQHCKRNHVILQMLLDDSITQNLNIALKIPSSSNVTNNNQNSNNIEEQIKYQQQKITKSNILPEMANVSSPTPKLTTNFFINKEINKSSKPTSKEYKLSDVRYQEEISEHLLLGDLIFILQGIEGKYIKFYQDIDAFAVDPTVNVSRPVRDLIGRICEFGWMFKQIRLFLTGPFPKNGLTNQSFCAAVKDEMTEFYRTIALLETEISNNQNNGPDANHITMTLRGMFVWIQEPLQRLKFLASLVSGVANLKGGQTMSYVHSFTSHGDSKIRKMSEDIIVRVSQPILAMIQRWIFEGEISDPYEEFFIAKFTSVPLEKTWREKYALRTNMIPAAIPLPMCRRILLLGKSINFMKHCCKEPYWSVDRRALNLSLSSLETIGDLDLQLPRVVEKTAQHSSKRLLDIIIGRFDFIEHVQALKRYMLLGQGDFIQCLMDTLGEDLLKPASQLSRHRLVGILESAVRNSNAQFESENVLKRLDISLLEERPGSIGWDIFSLDYHIDMPVSTIIQKQDITKYKKIFHFLWGVKRVEYSLTSVWRKTRSYNEILSNLKGFTKDIQRSHLLTNEMIHFMTNYHYYVMFEVIECSWDKLCQQVKEATDLDQLIEAHSKFLYEIGTKTFLTNSETCYDSFKKVLSIITQFTTLQSNVCYLAHAIQKEQILTESHYIKINRELNNYRTQLDSISKDYKHYFDLFEKELSKLKISQDVNPISLLYMLDFNEYYSNNGIGGGSN